MSAVNVGIIGCGRIFDLHAPGYEGLKTARIYAVCDSDPQLATERKKACRAEKSYQDYQELLADPEIQAVEILTPQLLHEPMAIAAAAAGKHIALQKPMTIDLASADRMLSAADASPALFKVTDNYLFYPPVVLAKSLIEQGEIGDPLSLRIKMISGGSGGWQVPASAWAWRAAENLQGRGLQTFDHGHHLWAVAWYLMGGFERVSAWIDSLDGFVDSPAVIMWKYRDAARYGSCEYLFSPQLHIPSKYYANDEWFEISGTRGILLIHRCTGEIVNGPGVTLFNGHSWRTFEEVATDWQEGFIGSTRNFIDAIRQDATPLLTGEQAREILKLNLAISQSARVRREVYVDELDADVPWAYTRARIRSELQAARRKQPGTKSGAAIDPAAILDEINTANEELLSRFDSAKAGGWQSRIRFELKLPDGAKRLFAFVFAENRVRMMTEDLPAEFDLTVRVSAETWIDILRQHRTLEAAFAAGELELDGKIEDGLKLKEVFAM